MILEALEQRARPSVHTACFRKDNFRHRAPVDDWRSLGDGITAFGPVRHLMCTGTWKDEGGTPGCSLRIIIRNKSDGSEVYNKVLPAVCRHNWESFTYRIPISGLNESAYDCSI